MRIALDLLYLIPGVVGGTETYARGLLTGLAEISPGHEFDVFVNREAAAWPLPDGGFRRIVCPLDGARRARRIFYEQARLPWALRARRVDLVHSLGYVAPVVSVCPSVVTIPDVHFLAYGGRRTFGRRAILRALVAASAARADHVLTISEFSRGEICRHLGVPPSSVTVTHLAPERRWTASRPSPGPAAGGADGAGHGVAFSSAAANKNILRLVEAWALARSRGLRQRLVVVGHLPPDLSRAPGEGLELAGWVDDARLMETVTGADFLIFPSLYEGFGLPVLEAMAAGVPVLCSNRGSLPEVAGEAALFFDPESTAEMAGAMLEAGRDPDLRNRLRASGFENAKRFSWQRAAMETLAVYEEVLRRRNERGRRRP